MHLPMARARTAATKDFDAGAWLDRANALAAQGLRVLAVRDATHMHGCRGPPCDTRHWSVDLCLIGLIGLIDPPRPEAADAVRECMAAGITPVMITGDHPATARAIALQLGIVTANDAPVLTGADLTALDDDALDGAGAPRARVRTG